MTEALGAPHVRGVEASELAVQRRRGERFEARDDVAARLTAEDDPADHRSRARARDASDVDAGFLEDVDHTDVRSRSNRAAAEGEDDAQSGALLRIRHALAADRTLRVVGIDRGPRPVLLDHPERDCRR